MMDLHMGSVSRIQLGPAEAERVRCCHCGWMVEVRKDQVRVGCPACGEEVAMQQLKMPAMPASGEAGRTAAAELTTVTCALPDGEREVRRLPVERVTRSRNSRRKREDETGRRRGAGERRIGRGKTRRIPFEARHRIEELREELFTDSAPRSGEGPAPLVGEMRAWIVLAVSATIFMVLVLLAVIVSGHGDGWVREVPEVRAGG